MSSVNKKIINIALEYVKAKPKINNVFIILKNILFKYFICA